MMNFEKKFILPFLKYLLKCKFDSQTLIKCDFFGRSVTQILFSGNIMTTLAGGFLVTNYHDAGRKVSKSNLDRGKKQRRPLRQTAVDAWRG